MKYIILVGDGMGDYPIAELGDKTPLEAANIPAMDKIAELGQLYRLKTVPDGYPPGSDVANLSLLGYRPEQFYTGRSPLEAASMNVELAEGEIAFRCNLVTLNSTGDGRTIMEDYSAGHISTPEAAELLKALASELNSDEIKFHSGISYRHLLVRNGLVDNLTTVPPHDYIGQDITEHLNCYKKVAGLAELLENASEILNNHRINRERIAAGKNPANAIWLWGEGKAPSMPTLEAQFGVTGALISAVDLLKGIGVYAGMEIIEVPGATGYIDTNYQGKASAAIKALESKDLVLVHVEAPDEAAHQGLLSDKMRAIEDFDQKIVKPIFEAASKKYDCRIAVTADHYTPVSLRTHVAAPVPLAIFSSSCQSPTPGHAYTENSAEKYGSLLDNGRQFMDILLAGNEDGRNN
jgi:2,3-bisphosphoglycerate-independent phosphoglycerate mutase